MCAEILRGVGAVLLHPKTGRRFVDELGTRDHITATMLEQTPKGREPHYVIVLNSKAAAVADKHVPLYVCSFVRSFARSLARSFVRSCVRS